jgi:hypothetical protein
MSPFDDDDDEDDDDGDDIFKGLRDTDESRNIQAGLPRQRTYIGWRIQLFYDEGTPAKPKDRLLLEDFMVNPPSFEDVRKLIERHRLDVLANHQGLNEARDTSDEEGEITYLEGCQTSWDLEEFNRRIAVLLRDLRSYFDQQQRAMDRHADFINLKDGEPPDLDIRDIQAFCTVRIFRVMAYHIQKEKPPEEKSKAT